MNCLDAGSKYSSNSIETNDTGLFSAPSSMFYKHSTNNYFMEKKFCAVLRECETLHDFWFRVKVSWKFDIQQSMQVNIWLTDEFDIEKVQ